MAQESHGLHHFHRRKRIYLHHEPFPHPIKWKRSLDKIIYVIGIVGPLMTLPQIYPIWSTQKAVGVSIFSWLAYMVIALVWLIYGIVHREKPIIITNILWILLEFLVV